jgi:hypothetical protein
MSFHRRSFSERTIRDQAKNSTYAEFEKWIVKPDSISYEDYYASMIYDSFFKGTKEERKQIYEQIKSGEI